MLSTNAAQVLLPNTEESTSVQATLSEDLQKAIQDCWWKTSHQNNGLCWARVRRGWFDDSRLLSSSRKRSSLRIVLEKVGQVMLHHTNRWRLNVTVNENDSNHALMEQWCFHHDPTLHHFVPSCFMTVFGEACSLDYFDLRCWLNVWMCFGAVNSWY